MDRGPRPGNGSRAAFPGFARRKFRRDIELTQGSGEPQAIELAGRGVIIIKFFGQGRRMPHLPPGNVFPPDGVPAPTSGPRLAGEMLRRQRETFGLDVDTVATALLIKSRYLAALEAGHPEQLPALAYALGFARSYAGWLGLDAGAVLHHLKEGPTGFAAKPELSFPMPPGERGSPGGAAVLTAMILAICGVAAWYCLSTEPPRRLEGVAPVPAELLAHTTAVPPAFGASIPPDRGEGFRSDTVGPPAAPTAPIPPVLRDTARAPKARSLHRR